MSSLAEAASETAILKFAERERVRCSRHPDDMNLIVAGAFGEIFQFNNRRLAVLHMPEHQQPGPRFWDLMLRRCKAVGMHVEQLADGEGSLTFDDSKPEQVALALKLAGIKRARLLTESERRARAERLRRVRVRGRAGR